MTALLLTALLGSAQAQDQSVAQSLLDPNGIYACTNDDIQPIWGTAGFANAMAALRTNATTWSATNFAEKRLFRDISEGEAGDDVVAAGYELNLTYNVAQLPVWARDAGFECPAEYRISNRVIDMQAQNIGFAFRKGSWGAFYASSVTFGAPAQDPFSRAMLWTMAAPIYSVVPLTMAPLLGSFQTQVGASAYAQDFVAGVTGNTDDFDIRAGYTRSRGWYGSVREKRLGLYGNVLVRNRFRLLGQAQAGMEGLPLGDTLGRTAVYGRSLPLTEEVDTTDNGQDDGFIEQLATGHVEQQDLFEYVDVELSYAVRPVRQLHTAIVAVHAPRFHTEGGGWIVKGGMVTMPMQAYYGTLGGPVATARVGFETPNVTALVMLNDAEQLALYPFAVNAVSVRLAANGVF